MFVIGTLDTSIRSNDAVVCYGPLQSGTLPTFYCGLYRLKIVIHDSILQILTSSGSNTYCIGIVSDARSTIPRVVFVQRISTNINVIKDGLEDFWASYESRIKVLHIFQQPYSCILHITKMIFGYFLDNIQAMIFDPI